MVQKVSSQMKTLTDVSRNKGNAQKNLTRPLTLCLLLTAHALALAGCGWQGKLFSRPTKNSGEAASVPAHGLSDASCAVALAPLGGKGLADQEIPRLQDEARRGTNSGRALERLGWLFVSKARLNYDPGYYKLAEASAVCLEAKQPHSPEALLLRAHVLHSLHRFNDAEVLARELVAMRGIPFDYGVLGDALMDEGRLSEAVAAYQKMNDMRPDLQSYTRAAYMRWLTGDLSGAIELMRMAARMGSPLDPEPAAWANTKLALFELQAGNTKMAQEACEAALDFRGDYAPALLARGRILLAGNKNAEAVKALQRAADLNPLPEYQWILADALRATERTEEADAVEAEIVRIGAVSDPRTLALFLATKGRQTDKALSLTQDELKTRQDVFTQDALAWSLAASGKAEEASTHMKEALAVGTKDARLFYHAGVIAAMTGRKQEARHWFGEAQVIRQMLLPSEREQLSKQRAAS
jgi:tetratricopeptide (TPR) repeat protein